MNKEYFFAIREKVKYLPIIVFFIILAPIIAIANEWQEPKNLEEINSIYDDNHPSISADGDTLYFTSDRPGGLGGHDIWMSEKRDESWQAPINLTELNSSFADWTPFISPDGQTIYFASNRDKGGGWDFDIYASEKSNGVWKQPKKLPTVNTSSYECCPSIPSDGSKLYFQSMEGGKSHIWQSEKINGVWQPPTRVFSWSYECWGPKVSFDGNTLYFGIDLPGLGQRDFWFSERVGGIWQQPINFTAINSPLDEDILAISSDSAIVFFASYREGSRGGHDIWVSNKNVDDDTDDDTIVYHDTMAPTGAVHAHPNTIWPPNNKMVTIALEGYVLDELSIARDGGGIGVSFAYLVVDGTEIILRDETTDLLGEDGKFNVAVEVKALKDAVYDVKLYASDTKPEGNGGPNSGLVDSTYILVPHDMGGK